MNKLTQYTGGSYVKALCALNAFFTALYLANHVVCYITLFGFKMDVIWITTMLFAVSIGGSAVWLTPDPSYKGTEKEGVPVLVKTIGTPPFTISFFVPFFFGCVLFLTVYGSVSHDLPSALFIINIMIHFFYMICSVLIAIMAYAIEYRILHGSGSEV